MLLSFFSAAITISPPIRNLSPDLYPIDVIYNGSMIRFVIDTNVLMSFYPSILLKP